MGRWLCGLLPRPTPTSQLASPQCPPQLSHLSSLTSTAFPGRYWETTELSRPCPGSDTLQSNPPDPGVRAGHRLQSDSIASRPAPATAGPESPRAPASSSRGIEEEAVARGWAWLGQGNRLVWAPWNARSHSSRRQGSSTSGPQQRGDAEPSRGSGATLDRALPGGHVQKQCLWCWAGPQVAEQSLHGVQSDHVG